MNNFNPTSSQPQLQTPNLFLSHISNLIYIKLDSSNYVLWKYQIRPSILWSYSLLDFIDGTWLNPEKYLLDKSGTAFKRWESTLSTKEGKRSSTSNSNQCYSFTLSIVFGSGTGHYARSWKVLEQWQCLYHKDMVVNLIYNYLLA